MTGVEIRATIVVAMRVLEGISSQDVNDAVNDMIEGTYKQLHDIVDALTVQEEAGE